MRWPSTLTIWAVCLFNMAAGNNVDLGAYLRRRTPTKYCGVQLSMALSAVCKGNYNSLHQSQQAGNAGRSYGYYGDQPLPYPYQSRRQARDVLGGRGRRRRRRGVYNECCEKPCTHEEIVTFCGPTVK